MSSKQTGTRVTSARQDMLQVDISQGHEWHRSGQSLNTGLLNTSFIAQGGEENQTESMSFLVFMVLGILFHEG